jgi:protein-tyrosine phosphatase
MENRRPDSSPRGGITVAGQCRDFTGLRWYLHHSGIAGANTTLADRSKPRRRSVSGQGAAAQSEGGRADLFYLLPVPSRSRTITLVGAHNFRDLGGYPAGDFQTRWGQLYRSDALQELTESDVAVVRRLGLRSIVDLRTAGEAEQTGRGRMAGEPVTYIDVSVSQDAAAARPSDWSTADDDVLVTRYMAYLETGGEAFVRALRFMADEDTLPMVFHCFFGKDRSGVLAALVLDCLGVDREAIVADYALSASAMPSLLAALARDPVYRDTIERTAPARLAATATTMEGFLARLDERHGGAANWAGQGGLQSGEILALRRLLLE